MARTFAPSPIRDLLHRRLQPFRHLHDCPGARRRRDRSRRSSSISWFRERSAPASASPSRGPGNGILWAETGGRFQPQNAGERPEFGSQTATRLTNRPELRGFLPARKPRRFAGTVAPGLFPALDRDEPIKLRVKLGATDLQHVERDDRRAAALENEQVAGPPACV